MEMSNAAIACSQGREQTHMMKIGWSRRDVSTTEPVNLPGQFHARISTDIMDPVMINALALENDGDLVIFVSGDFEGAVDLIDEIREKNSKKNG